MVSLNLSTKPYFTRPELLLHPSIPLHLSGKNPRTIKGQEWWDVVRREAYRKNNYHCEACGVYQLDAEYKQTLDAHETYTYDYEKFEAYPSEVVALCYACHMFIHWRRMWTRPQSKDIILRGLRIVAKAGLPLPEGLLRIARHMEWAVGEFEGLPVGPRVPIQALLSNKWKLILNGGVK